MARIRSVHPGLFTDEGFVSCSPLARLLVIGLWTEADDQGLFEWKPVTIKMRLLPVDNADVPALLAELADGNLIKRFAAVGREYGAIRNFRKYQRPKKPNTTHPLPDEFRTYVALDSASSELEDDEATASSEPAPRQPPSVPQKGEKSPQMEDGGGRREEGERKKDPEPNGSARSDPPPPANGAHPETGQESDEDRFWAMAGQCETKGITRSRMGRLMKLINAGELNYREAMNLVTASLRAREPSTYFGKAVGDREKEAGLRQPKEPPKRGAAKVPPFVAELQAEGIEVVPDGAGRWKSEGKTYDDSGGLIGW